MSGTEQVQHNVIDQIYILSHIEVSYLGCVHHDTTVQPDYMCDQTISLRAAFWGECFRLPVEPDLKLMGSAAVSDTSAACSNLLLVESSLDTFTLGALQHTLLFRTTLCFAA